MRTPTLITPDDLATFLGQEIDETRALLFISLAESQCEAYVSPLPDGARGIVLRLAANAMLNPVAAHTEHAGPFSIGMPTTQPQSLTLSAADVRQLRLLAGRGGAFTIDPTPQTAATGGMPWDENVQWLSGVPMLDGDDEVR